MAKTEDETIIGLAGLLRDAHKLIKLDRERFARVAALCAAYLSLYENGSGVAPDHDRDPASALAAYCELISPTHDKVTA